MKTRQIIGFAVLGLGSVAGYYYIKNKKNKASDVSGTPTTSGDVVPEGEVSNGETTSETDGILESAKIYATSKAEGIAELKKLIEEKQTVYNQCIENANNLSAWDKSRGKDKEARLNCTIGVGTELDVLKAKLKLLENDASTDLESHDVTSGGLIKDISNSQEILNYETALEFRNILLQKNGEYEKCMESAKCRGFSKAYCDRNRSRYQAKENDCLKTFQSFNGAEIKLKIEQLGYRYLDGQIYKIDNR